MKIDKKDYPKMPDDIKDMIKQQVENEITNNVSEIRPVTKRRFVRYAIAALAGTLLVGTTVYAASKLISITTEKKGEYGLETKVTVSENADGGEEKENTDSVKTNDSTTEVPYDRYELMQEENYVHLDISYMPEDVFTEWPGGQTSPKIHSYSETDRANRNITFYTWRIHEGIEYIHNDINVVNTEEFTVDGGTGILVELDGGERKVYMAYDIGYVLDIWARPGITKDELLSIAKGISLTVVTEEAAGMECVLEAPAYLPPYESAKEDTPIIDVAYEEEINEIRVSKDELDKIYQVGEEFQIPEQTGQFKSCEEATVKVTKVEISDDLSPLDSEVFSFFCGQQPGYIDENGKLKAETISYCKSGDGVNSLDEVVASETIPVKLVYVEVEYTSEAGDGDLLFASNLILVKEDDSGYEIFDGSSQLAEGTDYDKIRTEYYRNEPENIYFYNGNDVWEKNSFIGMKAGETRTASWCFIVREDWLPYMYLDVTASDKNYFHKSMLETGLIDIRQ